eukprot:680974-Rhodomonas_salina.6
MSSSDMGRAAAAKNRNVKNGIQSGGSQGFERVKKTMACELVTGWKQTSTESLTKGNKKEVKHHFDKLPPPPKLHSISCKKTTKQYPCILETKWAGVEAESMHFGNELPQLLHTRESSLSAPMWTHFRSYGSSLSVQRMGER